MLQYLRSHFWIFPAFAFPQTLRTTSLYPLAPEPFTLIKPVDTERAPRD